MVVEIVVELSEYFGSVLVQQKLGWEKQFDQEIFHWRRDNQRINNL